MMGLCSLHHHLAFRVLVDAAHPDLADAVTVHLICQEELYDDEQGQRTDMGLIISTAESSGEALERELEKLQAESKKPVALLIGADLAAFFLKYGGGLLS